MKPMLLGKSETLVLNDDWTLELKFDGIRAILTHDVTTKLETRNEKDMSVSFPEITSQAEGMLGATRVILDGEIVGFDSRGLHKLNFVQHRLGVKDPDKIAVRQKSYPVVFVAFDILRLNGKDVTRKPIEERREMLYEVVPKNAATNIVTAEVYPIAMMDALWDFIEDNNLEGLVTKRDGSKYVPGSRSPQWLKIKHHKMKVRT